MTPLLVVIGVAVVYYQTRVLPGLFTEAQRSVEAVNRTTSLSLASWLIEHRTVLRYAALLPSVTSFDERVALEDLRRITDSFEHVIAVIVARPDGTIILDSIRGAGGGNVADRAYFQGARAGQSTVSDLITSRTNERYTIMFSEPIRGISDSVIGVVFSPFYPETIDAALHEDYDIATVTSYVVGADGVIITGLGAGRTIDETAVPPIGDGGRYTNHVGTAVIGFRTFIPGSHWSLVSELSVAEAIRSFRQYNLVLVVVVAVALAATVMAGIIISGTIAGPISRLDRIARSIERDGLIAFREIPEMTRAPLEIRRLHSALASMARLVLDRQNQLRYASDLLESTQDMALLGSWEYDSATRRITGSAVAYRIVGYIPRREGISVEDVLSIVHAEDRVEFKHRFVRSVLDRETGFDIEHRIVQPDSDETRVIHQRCVHVRDDAGRLLRTRGMIQDITARHEIERSLRVALDDKSVLLSEVHHRVRNNLAIVESLLSLELARMPEDSMAADVLTESLRRVGSMSLVHQRLYDADSLTDIEMPGYIATLVTGIRDSFGRRDISITFDIDPIRLDMNRSIPCGMIINELVVNAFKHAFPDRSGTITVRLTHGPDGKITLCVCDDGVGTTDGTDVAQNTLGTELVTQLTRQLGGNVAINRDGGTRVAIEFYV
jgi:two-component sensor histidine kinase/PAS domain-containing protein